MIGNVTGGSLSSVPNGQLIDFEVAELRHVPLQDSLYLWVRGMLPGLNFKASLAPRVYHDQPEYWAIEIAAVSMPTEIDADADKSLQFERSIPLIGITGTKGIAVVGANQVKHIEVSSESV